MNNYRTNVFIRQIDYLVCFVWVGRIYGWQSCTELQHQLDLEKLKNEHLRQQVSEQKQLIENYQQQISQLNKTLDKANASIHDFAQVRLLEFKQLSSDDEAEPEQKSTMTPATAPKKKKRWFF